MHTNFTVLTITTPLLADTLVYHLRQTSKRAGFEGNHILTNNVGEKVEVRVSQTIADWMACAAA